MVVLNTTDAIYVWPLVDILALLSGLFRAAELQWEKFILRKRWRRQVKRRVTQTLLSDKRSKVSNLQVNLQPRNKIHHHIASYFHSNIFFIAANVSC